MARLGGSRRKRVNIFTKSSRDKGKIALRAFLQEFAVGDKVTLKLEPGIQRAMYLPRFHGKTGLVKRKQGDCYYVEIKDGNKTKEVIAHPVHLLRA
jgi:large subunit ribosomal protein L21e